MEKEKKEFEERVIEVNRVSRTVKGGRRLRFRALVAIGNLNGKVGIGLGKANEVAVAVAKAVNRAKKNIIEVPIHNDTITHEVRAHFSGAYIFLKPAAPGTSVIAGGTIRTVIELAGIKNILSKAFGSSNKVNNVAATFLALKSLQKDLSESTTKVNNEKVELDINADKKTKKIDKSTKVAKKVKDEIK